MTIVALIRFFFGVYLLVCFQTTRLSESLVTIRTLIGLFCCVYNLMIFQGTRPSEGHMTIRTLVGLFFGVYPLMSFEVRRLGKGHLTIFTLIPFQDGRHGGMIPQLLLHQKLELGHGFFCSRGLCGIGTGHQSLAWLQFNNI